MVGVFGVTFFSVLITVSFSFSKIFVTLPEYGTTNAKGVIFVSDVLPPIMK